MGKAQRNWARKKRDELIIILGGRCVICGTVEKLEFDCIQPNPLNNHHHREMGWDSRIRFYIKQHALKNLQLLCQADHGRKSKTENNQGYLSLYGNHQTEHENSPF